MRQLSIYLLLVLLCASISSLQAQSNLLDVLEEEGGEQVYVTEATFKGTRLINGHSIETRKKQSLELLISHRFGEINGGSYELFGLDQANIRIGLSYGITDRLTVGAGRNSFQKTYDGYIKYRILQQESAGGMPLSITGFASTAINTLRGMPFDSFGDRMTYTSQLLIARKVSAGLSLQLMPTFIHFNYKNAGQPSNDIFALGIGGRVKLSNRVSLNIEYYPTLQENGTGLHNSLAIGFDIETGGHVFQLQFTNSRAMIEKGFIAETNDNFFDGDIRFGFNISRNFELGGK